MPYVIDGSPHHTGVRIEHVVADHFTLETAAVLSAAYPGRQLTFVHRGGTQTVDDVQVRCDGERLTGISAKHHGGKSGTFDYINTSKVLDYLPNAALVVDQIAELKQLHYEDESAVPHVRAVLKEACSGLFDSLTSENIHTLLQVIDQRNSDWVTIVTPGEFLTIHHHALVELSYYPRDSTTHYELRGRPTASSRTIWRITDGVATNTTLRVRLTLNNGVGALLGLSRANRSSCLTLKIQQDSVDKLLRSLRTAPA